MTNERRIGAVSNALQILGALAEQPEGMGVSGLARSTGLGKSTVHAILATLCADEFVERTPESRYRLGLGAFHVGAAAVPGVPADGRLTPLLWGLAEESGEAVSLAIANRSMAVIVQRIESRSLLRAAIRVGTRMPLHSSASGKCFLAHMPLASVHAMYPADELPTLSGHTIQTKTELLRALEEIRANGYATNQQEYTDGVNGVATLVGGREGKAPLALSIAGPVHRFDHAAWSGRVQEVAKAMTESIVTGRGTNS